MNFIYKFVGVLFGISSVTLAPFLAFLWVGVSWPALLLVPLFMFISFAIGQFIYGLSEEAESNYLNTLQELTGALVALVVVVGIGFAIYDFFS